MSASRASRPSIERHATGCWSERPSCATRWRLWRQQGASCRPADIFDGLLLSTPHGDRSFVGEQVTAVPEDAVEASITTEQLTKTEASPTLEPDDITHHISGGELRHWIAIRLGVRHLDDPRLDEAEARFRSRERAQRLARENPSLALEAGIGRPDISEGPSTVRLST